MLICGLLAVVLTKTQPLNVEAFINGKGPYKLGLDTGQSIDFLVPPRLAKELALQQVGTVGASDGKNKANSKFKLVRAATLSACGITAKDSTGVAIENGVSGWAGAIGFPFFRNHLLEIDLANGIAIARQGALSTAMAGVTPFVLEQGTAMAKAAIAGRDYNMHLDTGADGGILIPLAWKDRFNFSSAPKFVNRMTTLFGKSDVFEAKLVGEITLGGMKLESPTVRLSDLFDFINVGRDTLAKAKITFDQRNKLVAIIPNEP